MGYYISTQLGYYEGDQIDSEDIIVPKRPDYSYNWDGNTWQPYQLSVEEKIALLEPTLRNLLDTTCQKYLYDDHKSAMGWAAFPNDWQTEAQTLSEWSANCWSVHFNILSEINSTHVIPTVEEYLSKLPVAPNLPIPN